MPLNKTNSFSTISVIGLGYIGLPTAAIIAARKIKVVGVEINPNTVETINQGKVHIIEPELDMLVHAAVSEGYLKATLSPEPADAFLITVPTPFKNNHEPDLQYIEAACQSIAPVLKPGNLVILESTSPVGTTQQLANWFSALRPDLSFPSEANEKPDIAIAYCPERVLPGHILRELVQNDRVVGGLTPDCTEKAKAFYSLFLEGQCLTTDARTAEMCKLTENSFRDVNIAFANELSMICERLDINVWELIRLANHHPRVNILKPGAGVGGHCIAVDPWFIVAQAPEQAKMIRCAREVNESKPDWVVQQVQAAVAEYLSLYPEKTERDVSIACLGLAFKPDIDDLRESPALALAKKITSIHAAPVYAVEPHIEEAPEGITLKRLDDALLEAQLIVKLVDHHAFAKINSKLQDGQIYLNFVSPS